MSSLPPLPANLKAIQHYLKTATEHDKRDPVVAYYCRLYAMQKGMEIDRQSPDCRSFLVALMEYMETMKTSMQDEAITNEVVGQAHVEDYALKVFLFADNEDRAGRFNKNVVKSFYSSGMLFDVLSVFGEPAEDIEKNKKYAKWKAAYIHRCLKNGETPTPGPMREEGDEEEDGAFGGAPVTSSTSQPGPSNFPTTQPDPAPGYPPPQQPSYPQQPGPPPQQPGNYNPSYGNLNLPSPAGSQPPGAHAPPSTPQQPQQPVGGTAVWTPPSNTAGVQLTADQYQKALKFCKYASSAIQYEDSTTAINNLTKALKLLSTGKDS
ncbi:vacuolar protein sorting-associated protein VTA1 homolog [Mizuhopecten yessoensis]|uniref:Vacuolar protein sorting-associated protein VTA1-like n=1 Tax=Mizuhopecten yessoensis TaxID=6573 RepID=A0A210QAT4_MIZYE|nr:vacuolar protein sorting-associated protein VTA1 homolog [Mizuhopecten yessoensis]OWF45848.1 Vacuolar protein sorting-associated protein VTA1-like [Mizuhopecten yessoensis]